MRELAVPQLAAVPDSGGLADVVFTNADEAPDSVVFRRKVGGAWREVTAAQFRTEVVEVAKGLIAEGVRPGDRIAILSANCYEWTLFDFAIWAAGAASVPIYVTSSAEQIEWIMSDSGAVGVVAENAELAQRVDQVRDKLGALEHVWRIDDEAVESLVGAGRALDDSAVEERRTAVEVDDLATLIYTSGTTGRPKGVTLTHRNLFASCNNAVEYLAALFKGDGTVDSPSTLLFLPLAHVFGRMVEVGAVIARATLGHWADVKTLTDNLAAFKPTFILSVPYVLEKVYNGARQKAHAGGKGKIFDAAAATAIAWSEADGKAGLGLKVKHAVFDKLVYSKLRAALGGQVKYAISGGAALGLRLTHFFRGVGITVYEGYGLTESTAASFVNSPFGAKPGTVGRPLPGTAVRITDDHEIQLRGDGVFTRYWQNETATSESIDDDGWFATGDLGELDDDGFLKITGRKKEILVTSGGKNVAPSVIEDRIAAHPLVGQALVVGDGQKYIAALITIDQDYFGYWKTTAGKDEKATVGDLAEDSDLNAEIQKAVDEGNLAVSKAESVRKFRILDTEFNPENGYLTPSLKLKRNVIMKDFSNEVDALYT
ncbi:AMP-dependent synthetase/ligase [Actinophytocola algeriensis]|uniref:Acyl-CoA synthetase n=1 Tax=Actinophytocola algeriensis TaxID=1768010 RepID=A0A7W7QFF1_9PSEU|nr:long-chain fatty acid--CoA ligase [Actinophytocola algeriensis]MBB4912592.1 long-chain acyl-CoA synthetase [Actinophytocola algeriensis]MBE1478966.1 long-chain acyl-CoA synthetase [Actinophytocola algeriensis]